VEARGEGDGIVRRRHGRAAMGEPAIVARSNRVSATSHRPIEPCSSEVEGDKNAKLKGISIQESEAREIAFQQRYASEPFEDPSPMPIVPLNKHVEGDVASGNFRASCQVVSAFLFLFCSWGIIGCYGTFFVYFKDVLVPASTASDLAWIGSVQHFLAVTVGILTSPWVDYGRMYIMCMAGSLLIVLGEMMASLGYAYVHLFFAHGICIGLGAGLIYLPCITCCSEYYSSKHRDKATGVATLGSSIGSLIFPIIFNKLVPQIGYPWTMRTIGFIILGLLACALLLYRPRREAMEPRQLFNSRIFTDKTYLIYVFGYFLGMLGLYVPNFFLPSFGKHHQFSPSIFPYTTSFSKAGGIVGRLLSICLTPRIGVFNLYAPRTLIAAALVYCWIPIQQQGSFLAVVILYGFFTGSLLSSTPNIVSAITEDVSEVNTRLGIASFIASFGILVGPPIAGALLQVEPPAYLRAQVFSAVFLTLSGLFMIATRILKVGWNPMIKY